MRTVTAGLLAWLAGSVVGTIVIVLPDRGPRLVSFREGHGPSLVDGIGIVMLLIAWGLFLMPLSRSRHRIRRAR